jgi:peptidoglycan/LPS O-acetylase OafA/YrhL
MITTKYRADIDGLRAIAVISVMLFHFRIPFISGGFAGVDIFFVISGFLIGGMVVESIERKDFSFLDFYARRARRIIPAFALVSFISVVVAYFMLLPNELVSFSRSLLASTLFAGNVYFYQNATYFALGAQETPLLHYWSLGVEEQFYFIFPVFCFFLNKLHINLRYGALVALIFSLVAAYYYSFIDSSATFYLLQFRAWELLIGAAAYFIYKKYSLIQLHREIISFFGLILTVVPLFLLDENSFSPALSAVPICIGAAMLLSSGGLPTPTLVQRGLGSAAPRYVGLISYSLYLFHWPVFVFLRAAFSNMHKWPLAISSLLITICAAIFSFYLVERPVRYGVLTKRVGLTFGAAGMVISILASASIYIEMKNGFPDRLDAAAAHYANYLNQNDVGFPGKPGCFHDGNISFNRLKFEDCVPNSDHTVVLWGDSGIAQYAAVLEQYFANIGYSMGQITASACPPVLNVDIPLRPQCKEFNSLVAQWLARRKPEVVILGGHWLTAEIAEHVKESVDLLTNAGIKVIILGAGPYFNSQPIPKVMIERIVNNNPSVMSDSKMLDGPRSKIGMIDNNLTSATKSANGNAFYISKIDAICGHGQCLLSDNGDPIYFDTFHVTSIGARYHISKIFPLIRDVLNH